MKNIQILIVEDSLTQADELRFILESHQYSVLHAPDAKTGLELAARFIPDMIVSDIVMPDMDGYRFCSLIKADSTLKNIPVILLTVLSEPKDVIKGLESGADSFLVKPYCEEFLISRIEYFLRNSALRNIPSNQAKLEILVDNQNYKINASPRQIFDVLMSTSENAIQKNKELIESNNKLNTARDNLTQLNAGLEQMVNLRTHDLKTINEELVNEIAERREVEDALFQSNEKFRAIFENNSAAIAIIEPDTTISMVNQAYCQISGYTEKEVVGMSWTKQISPDDLDRLKEYNRRRLMSHDNVPEEYEFNFYRKGGEIRTGLMSVSMAQNPQKIITSFIDITERKLAEELVKKTSTELQLIFSNMLNAFVIWESVFDEKGKYVSFRFGYINDACEHIAGVKQEDVRGKNVFEVWPGTEQSWVDVYGEVALTGIPHTFDMYHKPTQSWYHCNAYRQTESNKQVCVMFEDITEHKHAELEVIKAKEAAEKSEEYLNNIINSMGDPVFVKDDQSRIILVNDAFCDIFELSRNDIIGKSLAEDVKPDEQEHFLKIDRQVLGDGQDNITEELLTVRGGQTRTISTRKTRFIDNNGKRFLIGAIRDITETKQAEERIREKDIQFRKLSANLPDLIFQFTKRPDGTYCVPIASEGIRNIFGCSPDDVIDDFAPIVRVIYPDDAARVIRDIEYSAEHLTNFTCEFRVQIPGKEVQWILSRSTPEKLADGSITWYGFNTDITERKNIENDLRETKDYLENLFNYANAPIIVWDSNFRITQFNKAFEQLSGRSASEVLGKEVDILFPNRTRQQSQEYIKKTSTGDRWEVVEIEIQHVNGTISTLIWNSATIYFPDGKTMMATIAQGQDITMRKHAEEEIRFSETRYKQLHESMMDGFVFIDMKGLIKESNESYQQMLGYSNEELSELNYNDLTPEKWYDYEMKIVNEQVLLVGYSVVYEKEYRKKDGTIFPVELRTYLVKNFEGKNEGMWAIVRDITDRKLAEDALKESEEKYHLLFSEMTEGFAVHEIICNEVGVPVDYRFLMFNPSFEKLTGLRIEDTIGKTVREVIPGIEQFWIDTYGKVALTGEPVVFENYTKELDRYYRVVAFSHQKGQFAVLFDDITERKKIEKELNEAKENLEKRVVERTSELLKIKQLLDETGSTAKIGGWELDLETQKLTWTKAVFEIHELGYDFDPYLNNGISFYAPEAIPVITEAIEKCIKQGESWDLELPLITAKGNRIMVRAIGKAYAENGETTRIGGIFQDITQIKQAEEKLTKANDALEAFSYSVSHDLRAPLRAMNGFAVILLEDYALLLDNEGKRLLQVITDNARKMGQLIDDLLRFSRLNRQELRSSEIDMRTMADSVYHELAKEEELEKISFQLQDIPKAYGDPSLMRQVWINLIGNAIKFSSKKQNRVIEAGSIAGLEEHIYYVKDNGAGFDMAYVNKLFGVFQRLHVATDFEGTGVGLAIVKQIVNRMNGRVWAEGKENEGATFYFTLPGPKNK